jgi:hypothetical protein
MPGLSSPECSCTGLNYPMPSAVSTAVAPYIRDTSGGCATPRKAGSVELVGETVANIVLELHKGEPDDPIPKQNVTLATRMMGTGVSSATWTRAVLYSPVTVPPWVHLQQTAGFIPAGAEQMQLWMVAASEGLAERSEPYEAHLDLSVMSQDNVTLSVPIFLSISASTTSAVWGTVPEGKRCDQATGALSAFAQPLEGQLDLHFTACDLEHLPVQHRLPTVSDPREFSTIIRHANGEALKGLDYDVTMDMITPGKYLVQLTFLRLADYTVQLLLSEKQVAEPITISTECPAGRVPAGDGTCGCKKGFWLSTTGTVECLPCPLHTSSAAGAPTCTVCAEGRFRPTEDTLASTSTCQPCPAGASCPWNTTIGTLNVSAGF